MTASERDQAGRTPESLERTVHTYRKAWESEKEKNVVLTAEVVALSRERAAVRAAVLAEVVQTVKDMPDDYPDQFMKSVVLDILTQMEK